MQNATGESTQHSEQRLPNLNGSLAKLNVTVSMSPACEGFYLSSAYDAASKFKVQEALLPVNGL